MSWKDKLENIQLTITTGDGKVWNPLWRTAQKDVEYNTKGFEAIDIEGTFVNRKKKKGDKFPITLYFTGEDCVDRAKDFELSARDSRAWIYKHPFFDTIKVQPVKLRFDYSGNNVVAITGTLLETISNKYPQANILPQNTIEVEGIKATATLTQVFTEQINTPETGNITPTQNFINSFENIFESITQARENLAILKQLARTAASGAQNMIEDVTIFVEAIIDLINFPFILEQDIRFKIDAMVESMRSLKTIFINIADTSIAEDVRSKNYIFYELLTNQSLVSYSRMVTDSDYNSASDVLYGIDQLVEIYNEILTNFEDVGYDQNPENALGMDVLINTTVANLYEIAYNTRKERVVVLNKDSNLILLAHEYYGRGDDFIDDFIAQNKIKSDEYVQIRAGREIKYYVK